MNRFANLADRTLKDEVQATVPASTQPIAQIPTPPSRPQGDLWLLRA